jgi:hypothetical protein
MILLIPPSMAFNFFTGSKGLFFAPLAMVAMAYIVVRRRLQVRWILVAWLAFVLFYPIADYHRRVILKDNSLGAAYAIRRPVEVMTRIGRFAVNLPASEYLRMGTSATIGRFDGLGILAVIMRDCPSRVPFQGGWTIGYIALAYVPRIVWADKPTLSVGGWITDNFLARGMRSSTGSTWIGELYFNFGWSGIVVGMLLMGIYFRVLHEVLFSADSVLAAQVMAVIMLFATPPTLGGTLQTPLTASMMGAIPIVVAHWTIRLTGGRPRRWDEPDRELSAEARAS